MTMKVGEKVFVYGTLRKGRSANGKFDGKAEFKGTTRITAELYDISWFPGIRVVGNGEFISEGPTVVGDVYEITSDDLSSRLDSYEGYPTLYGRKQVQTESGETVWVYEFNDDNPREKYRLITTGEWDG